MIQIIPHKAKRGPWRMEEKEITPPPGYVRARILLSEPDEPDDPIVLPVAPSDKRKNQPYGAQLKRFIEAVKTMKGEFVSADFIEHGFTVRDANGLLLDLTKKGFVVRLRPVAREKGIAGRPAWIFKRNPKAPELQVRGAA